MARHARIEVYHPVLDTVAVIAAKTLPLRQRKGWVTLDDVETSPDSEEPTTTPPSVGDNDTPNSGEE